VKDIQKRIRYPRACKDHWGGCAWAPRSGRTDAIDRVDDWPAPASMPW